LYESPASCLSIFRFVPSPSFSLHPPALMRRGAGCYR
jgi:hypothetical protein